MFSSHLSLDRKTTNKKAGSGTICPKPPAQAHKCLVKSPEGGQLQEAWFKSQLLQSACGVSTVTNTEAFRKEGMTFRKRKKAHVASPVLEKRQQVLKAPSGA